MRLCTNGQSVLSEREVVAEHATLEGGNLQRGNVLLKDLLIRKSLIGWLSGIRAILGANISIFSLTLNSLSRSLSFSLSSFLIFMSYSLANKATHRLCAVGTPPKNEARYRLENSRVVQH